MFVVTEPARAHWASSGLVKEATALRDADRARVRAMMEYSGRFGHRNEIDEIFRDLVAHDDVGRMSFPGISARE